jgi:hypothetical protein
MFVFIFKLENNHGIRPPHLRLQKYKHSTTCSSELPYIVPLVIQKYHV